MADLNDLQREWDHQPEYSEEKMNEIVDALKTRSGTLRSQLFARDMGEVFACLFIIVAFGSYWFAATNSLTRWGIAINIVGALEIALVLQLVRQRAADFASVPLLEFLQSELQLLNREIWLLRHIAWWYLLPLYIGTCLFVIGIGSAPEWESGPLFSFWFCVGYFVMCGFLWKLNQFARKKNLEPLRDALQTTYEGLSAMDTEATQAPHDLLDVLNDPALDQDARFVHFTKPRWHQTVVIALACLGGFLGGMQIQQWSGEPMRYEEWPLLGLMLAAGVSIGSICVRRPSKMD